MATVDVEGGKYTFISDHTGVQIRRYREPWVTVGEGVNAVAALVREFDTMADELEAKRLQVTNAQAALADVVEKLQRATDAYNDILASLPRA